MPGVYRVFSEGNGSFVGYSHNVEGSMKRLRFELALNSCSYRPLQEFCNTHKDYRIELLQEYAPDAMMSIEEVDAHLMALCLSWRTNLNARAIQDIAAM